MSASSLIARRAAELLLLVPVCVVFQSILWAEQVLLGPKLAVIALAAVSMWRPRDGLLVLAALGPFGSVLGDPVGIGRGVADALAAARPPGYPAALSEALLPVIQDPTHRFGGAMVLAFLIGYALRQVWRRHDGASVPASLLAPAVLLGATALASCIVNIGVWRVWDLAFQSDHRLLDFVVWGYHNPISTHPSAPADAFDSIQAAVGTLTMSAMLLVTFSLCRGDAEYVGRLARMLVLGAAAAALLSFAAMAMYIVSHPDAGAVRTALAQRWTFVSTLNTGAPGLVLVAPIAIACGFLPGANRAVWWGATAVLLAALWSNGTRAAILPGVAVGGAALLWLVREHASRRVRLAVVAGILIVGTGVIAATAVRMRGVDSYLRTAHDRLEFARQAVHLIAERPVLGHGIDQYGRAARRRDASSTPHNLYLRRAGELGVVGLGLLLWLIGSAMWPILRGLRARPTDVLLLAACTGLTALLIANLGRAGFGRFSLVAGFAAALAFDRISRTGGGPIPTVHSWPAGLRAFTIAGMVLLAASIPWRIDRHARDIDLSHLESGLDRWEAASDGRFRWTRGPVEFFVHPSVTAIELPVRAQGVGLTGPRHVAVQLNGSIEQRLLLTENRWQPIRLVLPPSGRVWRKVELDAGPTWIPRDVLPGSTDPRELGVMTGELRRCYGAVTEDGVCRDGWTRDGS